jgi:hypothetical protein
MAEEYALSWGETASSNDRMWATLSWLAAFVAPFLGPGLIWMLFSEKSKFIKYHAAQSLILHVALWIILPVITTATCGFGGILYAPAVFVPLYGAYLSWNGEWKGMPILSDFGK